MVGGKNPFNSRLIAEWRRSLASEGLVSASEAGIGDDARGAAPQRIGWCEGRSLSYESTTPYAPFVDLFNDCFGLRTGQAEAEPYEKEAKRLTELMPARASETVPFIA